MNKEKFSRTISLIGEEHFNNIQNKKIFIAGLGGVGGTTFIALVRMGFRKFILVDKDVVDITNLNRQLLYLEKDIGFPKVEVAKNYAKNIDQDVEIEIHKDDVKNVDIKEVDFVIDCIDDVNAKIDLIKRSSELNIPLISSMGMANKLDPTRIKVATLNKSSYDPLAKKMRYELKSRNIDISNIMCVYSDESPIKDGNKLNSLITVTSTAGLEIANYVLYFLKRI